MFAPGKRKFYKPSLRLGLRLVSVLTLLLVLAGPHLGWQDETLTNRQKEIYFLLDVSNSMNCSDLKPSRLSKSKKLIQQMAQNLNGEKMGLIAFTDYGYTTCPLTRDVRMLNLFVNLLETRQFGNRGTNYRKALNECLNRFPPSKGLFRPSKRFIVMFSDGENFSDPYQSVLNKLKSSNIRVIGVGVGTEQRCFVTQIDENGNAQRLFDNKGQVAISKFEDTQLRILSAETQGKYFRFDNNNNPEIEILDYLNRQSASASETLLVKQEYNVFIPLIGFSLLCWLVSMFILPEKVNKKNYINI